MLAPNFFASIRSRGRSYFDSGAVVIESADDRSIRARVSGYEPYHVMLNWTGTVLETSCTCPYARSTGPCKHVWAVVVAADVNDYLSAVPRDAQGSFSSRGMHPPQKDTAPRPPAPPKPPEWRQRLAAVHQDRKVAEAAQREPWPFRRQILYAIDAPASRTSGRLVLELIMRDRAVKGDRWNAEKELKWPRHAIGQLPDPLDRQILARLAGGSDSWGYTDYAMLRARNTVYSQLALDLMPLLCRTGRCLLRESAGRTEDLPGLTWEEGGPWEFGLRLAEAGGKWTAAGELRRGDARLGVRSPQLVLSGGLLIWKDRAGCLAEGTPLEWIHHLRRQGPLETGVTDRDEMLAALLQDPLAPLVEVPEELRYEEVRVTPRPALHVGGLRPRDRAGRLQANLYFDYQGFRVPAEDPSASFYDAAARRLVRRDAAGEEAAARLLGEHGVKSERVYGDAGLVWSLPAARLPELVRTLLAAQWHVEADGGAFRTGSTPRLSVATGIDWFELNGEVDFGEITAQLPDLLRALRRGESMVRLDDGSYGLLPEDWLARLGTLAGMGTGAGDTLRFGRSQAGLLDALLAARPEIGCDEAFARIREQLRSFGGVRACDQPAGFCGQLRDYQREGLGWMNFLREFGFGGCLADDMGVGKTAQVLAVLEARRAEGGAGPSLVVAPKSLVFNWKLEAQRFTPNLRVLDHTGIGRSFRHIDRHDLVLTTYGTLRRDVALLQDVEFDYVVLDEAQAVKNAASESAKAVRLVRGRHRLALSGTPVENHLGELWSLFEFLNPGMLGSASVFRSAEGALRNPDEETRSLLAHALRPFILRRTKAQVARELPPKTEQVIHCEMEAPQRKLYEDLRNQYRASLLGRVRSDGIARSKMHILEALLRLRQAACHPGLLDPDRTGDPSAKLDFLIEQIEEVVDGGHKALVFSQFTSLLAILRDRLDARGIVYEYLDGKTRDRQARVERFQADTACPLFLLSLKAGGLGLNLTAAEYVFLLDPWWNPAVEAQAVDRTHRIGQTRPVSAYRLITKGTVEEKVLELQQSKRELAAAIIGADNALIRDLRTEDLELLLS